MATRSMSASIRVERTSTPPTLTLPAFTSQKRATSRAIVDLPEPDGPTSAVTPPAGKDRDAPWMTSRPGV